MIVQKVGEHIYAKVPYEMRDTFKAKVKGATWMPSMRCWAVPATISTFKNLRKYDPKTMDPNALTPEIRTWYNGLVKLSRRLDELQKGTGEEPKFPEDFYFPIPPHKHQREAIAFSINLPKAALWLDLGLGKTYTSIMVAKYRHQYTGVNKVLVFLPLAITYQWQTELKKYLPEADVIVVDGDPLRKRKRLQYVADADRLTFALISYDSVPSLRQNLIDVGFDMFIMDESTKIKNPKAVRTEACVDVCRMIKYGLQLTGLPYLNNPTDLFSQFQALDPTIYGDNRWQFEDYYLNKVKTGFGHIVRGFKHFDELKQRAYYVAFSRNKKDCLDLPEKTYNLRKMPMYDTQKEWYDKVVAGALEETEINCILAQIEKLQQVTSGFVYMDDIDGRRKTVWFDSPKYVEICDVIQESNDNFLIWAKHEAAINRMLEALEVRNIPAAELSRRTGISDRKKSVIDFKNGVGPKVLVCQINSECRGLDLTSKNQVSAIYLENTFSIDERWQSESRNHRIGMFGTATYVDVLIEDTIDEKVTDVLASKLELSEYIAQYGLEILLGKGGSIQARRTRSKKKPPTPGDIEIYNVDADIEGFEDLV